MAEPKYKVAGRHGTDGFKNIGRCFGNHGRSSSVLSIGSVKRGEDGSFASNGRKAAITRDGKMFGCFYTSINCRRCVSMLAQ